MWPGGSLIFLFNVIIFVLPHESTSPFAVKTSKQVSYEVTGIKTKKISSEFLGGNIKRSNSYFYSWTLGKKHHHVLNTY
jgi:hypothetical protein